MADILNSNFGQIVKRYLDMLDTTWAEVVAIRGVPPKNATVAAYAASKVIKNAAGTLRSVSGYNSKAAPQFIQLHDAAALPADTAVPAVILFVGAQSNFSFDFGLSGRSFANGIVVCNSSTGPTKTIGAADCWFDGQYF